MKNFINIIIIKVYRIFIFPFRRFFEYLKTGLVCETRAYFDHSTLFEGKNKLGYSVFISESYLGYGSYISERTSLHKTYVGRYTSIGCGVQTAVGRHPISECISTSPLLYDKNFQNLKYVKDKYCIYIGNDVWIGTGVIILDGISIGDGAIIGAGSIVVKDIPPYSIQVGNPAHEIKKRFDDSIIAKLLQYQWWNKEKEWISHNAKAFDNPVEFIKLLERQKNE